MDIQEAKRRLSTEFLDHSKRPYVCSVGSKEGSLYMILSEPRQASWGLPDEFDGYSIKYIIDDVFRAGPAESGGRMREHRFSGN